MIHENHPARALLDVLNTYDLRGKSRSDAGQMLIEAACGMVSVFTAKGRVFAATLGRNGNLVVSVEAIYPNGREQAKALAIASLAMRGRAQQAKEVLS
jgi:hypothetical protein|nr:MAG TPA: hypothetical protein [Caudoviricetes sp.]